MPFDGLFESQVQSRFGVGAGQLGRHAESLIVVGIPVRILVGGVTRLDTLGGVQNVAYRGRDGAIEDVEVGYIPRVTSVIGNLRTVTANIRRSCFGPACNFAVNRVRVAGKSTLFHDRERVECSVRVPRTESTPASVHGGSVVVTTGILIEPRVSVTAENVIGSTSIARVEGSEYREVLRSRHYIFTPDKRIAVSTPRSVEADRVPG